MAGLRDACTSGRTKDASSGKINRAGADRAANPLAATPRGRTGDLRRFVKAGNNPATPQHRAAAAKVVTVPTVNRSWLSGEASAILRVSIERPTKGPRSP